jgi:hypothetical protein
VAYLIKPWRLAAWRVVLLTADLITLCLLLILLRKLDRSLMGVVIYWWNPLLIKEIYNSCHMEVIIFPFVLGALLLSFRQKHVSASLALGLGVGAKLWPILMFPVLVRPLLKKPKRLIPPVLAFVGTGLVMLLPQCLTGLDTRAGITAYSKAWEMNDSLFMIILWIMQWLAGSVGYPLHQAQLWARFAALALLSAWVVWVIREEAPSPLDMVRRSLLILAALFFISPTQFPWYFLWILPFLALDPRASLLLLTALLPLYYLRYFFKARGMVHIHDYGVVWIEFIPVWILLIWEWYKGRKR